MIYVYKRRPKDVEYYLVQEFEFPMGEAPETFVDTEGNKWSRVYTVPALEFKGSGFYSTDNRKGYIIPEVRKEMKESREKARDTK